MEREGGAATQGAVRLKSCRLHTYSFPSEVTDMRKEIRSQSEGRRERRLAAAILLNQHRGLALLRPPAGGPAMGLSSSQDRVISKALPPPPAEYITIEGPSLDPGGAGVACCPAISLNRVFPWRIAFNIHTILGFLWSLRAGDVCSSPD